jgi:transcription initiation factor TFIIIB Brf1 subunit/transcription initiation factor TFIIB
MCCIRTFLLIRKHCEECGVPTSNFSKDPSDYSKVYICKDCIAILTADFMKENPEIETLWIAAGFS